LVEFRASPNDAGLVRVLKGILNSYHNDASKVVFDKSRGWCAYLELAEMLIERKAKVLVPVRDVRDIVASFEMLWRKNASMRQTFQEAGKYFEWQTQEGRVKAFLDHTQTTGLAYNRIKDALHRGFGDRMLLVKFDNLTTHPEATMKQIYKFLGEEYFEHGFDNVKQVTYENDLIHGVPDLHKIRSKVDPVPSKWREVLGAEFEHLGKLNFWEKPKAEPKAEPVKK
jgi:sulfotransferase